MSQCAALIVAGGVASRFGADAGKQLAPLGGRPLLAHTVSRFDESARVDEIVLVCHPDRVAEYEQAVRGSIELSKPLTAVAGGETRQQSVANGLEAVSVNVDLVAVHDGARPLVEAEIIDGVIDSLDSDRAAAGYVVGHPAYDTLKRVSGTDVIETPDRSEFWVATTPQVFRAEALRAAYRAASEHGRSGTDDASLVEASGGAVRMYRGPRSNIKVTVMEDLSIAEALLSDEVGINE